MNLYDWKIIPVKDIANVGRAQPGKIYKAGTCFVKLSAVDDEVGQLTEPGTLDGRYAAIEPHDGIDVIYLKDMLDRDFPVFLRRYRTTINLQESALKHLTIHYHNDPEARQAVSESLRLVNAAIAEVQKQIEGEKEIKRWYLNGMMV